MAKNNKKSSDREEKEKDPLALFIKRSTNWVNEYAKTVFVFLFAGLLVFASVLLFSYLQKQLNEKGESALYESRKKLALAEQKAGGNVLSLDRNRDFFGQAKKAKYDPSIDKPAQDYVKVIQEWIKRPSGATAAVEMSHFFYQYEKKQPAIELLKKAGAYKKKDLTGFLIAFQLGTYLMDQNECESAIKEFRFITVNDEAKWLWPSALVRTALCYEKQNKTDMAKKIYKQIKNDFSDSQAGMKATQYLNLLEVQDKVKGGGGDQGNTDSPPEPKKESKSKAVESEESKAVESEESKAVESEESKPVEAGE